MLGICSQHRPKPKAQTNKSHKIKVPQKTLVAQKTFCAVLPLSVARLSSLFPLPTFSVVLSESSTSWSMWAACMLRLVASVDCSSAISVSDFSVWLLAVSTYQGREREREKKKGYTSGTYRTLSSWSSYCLSISWFSCANSCSCSGSSWFSITALDSSCVYVDLAL